jgi:transposase
VGTKVSIEAKRPSRKGRANHPIEFKRRLAQRACEPGGSVSQLAQEHGINANMLFKWRRHYRAGLFDEVSASPALLPVSVVSATPNRSIVEPRPVRTQAAPQAGIEIIFTDCTVRIGSHVDMGTLRAVLTQLRR